MHSSGTNPGCGATFEVAAMIAFRREQRSCDKCEAAPHIAMNHLGITMILPSKGGSVRTTEGSTAHGFGKLPGT